MTKITFLHAALLLSASIAPAASAGQISNEISASGTDTTEQNPRSGNLADSLNASFDLSDSWTLTAGATLTLEGTTPRSSKGSFADNGGAVGLFSLGLDWDANDHVTLALTFDHSPESEQKTDVPLPPMLLPRRGGGTAVQQPDGLLVSRNANSDLSFLVGYDSAGETGLEYSLTGGVTLSHFANDQKVTTLRTQDGQTFTAAEVRAGCTTKRCNRILNALSGTPDSLDSAKLSLTGTLTLAQDTDLTLGGDVYGYAEDPTGFGYFSVGKVGRSMGSTGSGVPLAPLRFQVRPEVSHRFGESFSARLWAFGGQYVADTAGTTSGLGLKLQYKFTKAFRLWLTLSGQRDTDSVGSTEGSRLLALGAGYRF